MVNAMLVLAIVAGLAIAYLIVTYNTLIRLRQRVHNAWSQMDVQLKRRYDLIPNMINAVKGYAQHEKETLDKVTQARTIAMGAGSVAEQARAETLLTGALKTLFAVAEAYPELKANANFIQLQAELSDTENKIAFARQFYNDTVQIFNTKIELFPTNLLAGMLGFEIVDYFTLQDEAQARQNVKVNF